MFSPMLQRFKKAMTHYILLSMTWFNHKLLKNTQDGNNNEAPINQLPENVLVHILTKLDIVTLYRLAAASRTFLHLLPQVPSISTTLLPSRVLVPVEAKTWKYPFFDSLRRSIVAGFFNPPPFLTGMTNPRFVGAMFMEFAFMQRYVPRISTPCMESFRRLTGLLSVEVELPAPSDARYLTQPSSWFKWDAELHGTVKPRGYFIFALGEVVGQHDGGLGWLFGGAKKRVFENDIDRFEHMRSHLTYHWLTARNLLLSKEGGLGHLRAVVTKDKGKNGRLRLESGGECGSNGNCSDRDLQEWLLDRCRLRVRTCYVPTIVRLDNGSVQIKEASLLFVAWVDDGDETDIDDLIRAKLGFRQGDEGLEDGDRDGRKELREAVRSILDHENAVSFVGLRK